MQTEEVFGKCSKDGVNILKIFISIPQKLHVIHT